MDEFGKEDRNKGASIGLFIIILYMIFSGIANKFDRLEEEMEYLFYDLEYAIDIQTETIKELKTEIQELKEESNYIKTLLENIADHLEINN